MIPRPLEGRDSSPPVRAIFPLDGSLRHVSCRDHDLGPQGDEIK